MRAEVASLTVRATPPTGSQALAHVEGEVRDAGNVAVLTTEPGDFAVTATLAP